MRANRMLYNTADRQSCTILAVEYESAQWRPGVEPG